MTRVRLLDDGSERLLGGCLCCLGAGMTLSQKALVIALQVLEYHVALSQHVRRANMHHLSAAPE